VCLLPLEYCSYGPSPDKCRQTLQREDRALFARHYEGVDPADALKALQISDEGSAPAASAATGPPVDAGEVIGLEDAPPEEKKKSASGKQKKGDAAATVTIKTEKKAKKKSVTVVTGLEAFGLDLKKTAKLFAGKFACGSSVVKNASNVEEIVIQGDVPDRVAELLVKEHPDKVSLSFSVGKDRRSRRLFPHLTPTA
jgi:density-regulated protein DRP1